MTKRRTPGSLAVTTRGFGTTLWIVETFVADDRVFALGCCVPGQAKKTHG